MQLIQGLFSKFQLSDQETLNALSITVELAAWMQNEMAIKAEERIQLKFDPANPMEFVQRDAELQGVIVFIRFFLDQVETAVQFNKGVTS